jgi:hypothetical protein
MPALWNISPSRLSSRANSVAHSGRLLDVGHVGDHRFAVGGQHGGDRGAPHNVITPLSAGVSASRRRRPIAASTICSRPASTSSTTTASVGALREQHAERSAVVGVAFAAHEPIALAEPDELGDALLGQARDPGQLAHAQPVALEQRQQHRAVGRAHVGEAALREAFGEQLVEALGGRRQQEAEVVGRREP